MSPSPRTRPLTLGPPFLHLRRSTFQFLNRSLQLEPFCIGRLGGQWGRPPSPILVLEHFFSKSPFSVQNSPWLISTGNDRVGTPFPLLVFRNATSYGRQCNHFPVKTALYSIQDSEMSKFSGVETLTQTPISAWFASRACERSGAAKFPLTAPLI